MVTQTVTTIRIKTTRSMKP